jgi:hypothetical protein
MKQAGIGRDQLLIAHHEAPKVAQPGKGPLYDPPAPIPPQFTAILVRGPLMIGAGGNDWLDAAAGQPGTQGIAVIPPIGNQTLGPFAGASWLARAADRDGVERLFEERDFRRGSRLQVCSQRSTRAIDHHHPLCALTPLGLADFGSPLLAGTKLPSAKHSSQRSFSRSLSWARNARHNLSRMPISSQCLSRRQHVLGLLYRRGSSLHWAPVQRIQRMPSKQRRSSTRGRPPRPDGFDVGRWGRMASHCCLVSPRHAMTRLPFSLAIHDVMVPQPAGFEMTSRHFH